MGCNCRKNRQVYTGPPAEPVIVNTSSQTGGQPPIETVVADGRPTAPPQ